MKAGMKVMDGNEAAAHVAYKLSEVCAIYPITPSSTMGELAEQWASQGNKNLWGTVPHVVEMQSEGGAIGAAHGALQTGALTTTFTASQGLLLMIPNLFKIAGELTPAVFHVAARSLATHALSIFGDHSDIMAVRSTGFALLSSASVQEAHDLALVSHAATLRARIPFLHFFDGFRTSHELNKIEELSDDVIRAMIDEDLVFAHRQRGLSPEHPVIRGTAQNPDVFFQAREACSPYYKAVPDIVEHYMERFATLTGRRYKLYEYYGSANAEAVIIIMGSGADTARETADYLNARGRNVGVLQIRLFRPFSLKHFLAVLPPSVKRIAVLDRTKEPGAIGEPLYQDVITAMVEGIATGQREGMPRVIGGRYGLSSKDFTPGMVKAVFDELEKPQSKHAFTVGIVDDVSHSSLAYDPALTILKDVKQALFFGLGADGTVGANHNTIKIIGEETEQYAQGYFVYDSKKSGSRTVSHLRFGPGKIAAPYLIQAANFTGVHQFQFLTQVDVLENAAPGGTLLLNCPHSPEQAWERLPQNVQAGILEKDLKVYVIDAYRVAMETGMGGRINTIMQTCFFAIAGVLPADEAIERIKQTIRKTYGRKGEDVVRRNCEAVDQTLANLHRLKTGTSVEASVGRAATVRLPESAPVFVRRFTAALMEDLGEKLPVSSMPADGTFPTGTAKYEKRNIAQLVPDWEADLCIECGNCAFVCPHSCIRAKLYETKELDGAPDAFKHAKLRGRGFPDHRYTLHVSLEDCTGCGLCVEACPVELANNGGRAINMKPKEGLMEREQVNGAFFEKLPYNNRERINFGTVRGVQYLEPLFEFSGACAGCGETPYLKLLSQLYGDRLMIANATGCSSIYGGNLPTTPWSKNAAGRGPAWANSLFEDNAEFGLGYRLTVDKHKENAGELLKELSPQLGGDLVSELLNAVQVTEKQVKEQRERVDTLKARLAGLPGWKPQHLLSLADNLVRRSVWIIGGDGWAYDIGYGGLDHVLASGRKVNVLVLDTEVYSNTGGQASKSTPLGAVAKFATNGKLVGKKDLALAAISYGTVYVARIAMGANPQQALKAFREAEEFPGASLIISYSHCIAHGMNMNHGLRQQKLAVESGHWPLLRFNPLLKDTGQNPLTLDSTRGNIPLEDYIYKEARYKMLTKSNPERADRLLEMAQKAVDERWAFYEMLATSYKHGRIDPSLVAGSPVPQANQ